jgi:formylglycine-generating enzyme required for sulfatase activity
MIVLWMLLGCSPSSLMELDTGSGSFPESDLNACDMPDLSTGLPDGIVDCEEELCWVESGTFWMGESDALQPDRCPAREVTLSAFGIDRTEVTIERWRLCVEDGGCDPLPALCGDIDTVMASGSKPVACITLTQAESFCSWTGGRIPSEAEWEKSARGSQGAIWPWGSLAPSCNDGNFRFVTSYCELEPVEVGSYPMTLTPYGLLDTLGNVWEWTADRYDAEWYSRAPDEDPDGPETDCHARVGDPGAACDLQVIRGGAFNTPEETTRGSSRSFASPDIRDDNIGLRCAYDAR